jgi:Family of unknown function (DUF6130)
MEKITAAVTEHCSTGSGRRLRQIVWSIYNGRTLVNLGDVLTNFDGELCEAVATLNHAKLCSVDMDDLLREVLKRSGEFFRSPRIGHIHITVDDAPWQFVDAGGETIILVGLQPGRIKC